MGIRKELNSKAIIDSNRVLNDGIGKLASKRKYICPCGERFTYELNLDKHIKRCGIYYEQEVRNG